MRLWLSPTGQIQRLQLLGSTGDPAMDKALTRVITALGAVTAPPADMPQPVNMRVRARGGF
jgi:TonB family protein